MQKTKHLRSFFRNLFFGSISIAFAFIIIGGLFLFYTALTLPNIDQLKDAHLQVPLKIYTADGQLIGEYGAKRRTPVAINQVPPQLIRAILDTEDQRFYQHSGVDFVGLARAAKVLFTTGKKEQGASTITMQVARNFFLSRKKTYYRKFKEIILAIKIDRELSKNTILQLYLNKIYLGQRAYGVVAAAHTYYGLPLEKLTLAQLAMIAGLPQAPSRDNPIANPKAALERRNHVLTRMFKKGDINLAEYHSALKAPVTASYHEQQPKIKAPFLGEMVRQTMLDKYGDKIYESGLKVYTTIDSKLQTIANNSLRNGLIGYSGRHQYYGPETNFGSLPDNLYEWREKLDKINVINGLEPAAVTKINNDGVTALLTNGNLVNITTKEKLNIGDVIRTEYTKGNWQLRQIPKVSGALVALNPQTGAIVALDGGFAFENHKFNCATQAIRQPGSSFKPFVYSAALAKGFTLASIINDAPIVMADNGANALWRPQNVTRKFYGPTRLRVALAKSRNLVSIRLLQAIGIPFARDYIERFGFKADSLPPSLSLALGTANITPLDLAGGYAVFANGGSYVKPYFIDHIVDENGKTIFQAESTPMRVITTQNAYLMNSAMQGVIKQGTGRAALRLDRSDLAGKTGTTNQQLDAWFSGFNGSLVTTIWVGFEQPQSLHEYGAQAALPIWIDFMSKALVNQPENSMAQPSGIITVRIDPKTGLVATPGQQNAIFELFRKQYAPKQTNDDTTEETNDAELF